MRQCWIIKFTCKINILPFQWLWLLLKIELNRKIFFLSKQEKQDNLLLFLKRSPFWRGEESEKRRPRLGESFRLAPRVAPRKQSEVLLDWTGGVSDSLDGEHWGGEDNPSLIILISHLLMFKSSQTVTWNIFDNEFLVKTKLLE